MLSSRAQEWAKVDFAHGLQDKYDAINCPEGLVDFGNAENLLMHADLTDFINANVHFTTRSCAYGEGFTGTKRLREAMSGFLNQNLQPIEAFTAEQITFAAGVTALNEICAMITCDPNEAIMLPMPIYGAFSRDLTLKTGVKLEYVPVGEVDQFTTTSIAAYEAGYQDAQARGVNIKALLICNPHNPLGQCYSRQALIALAQFCASKNIHLISDEIYALSVYQRPDRPSESFTSIRSIALEGILAPEQVHVLYGLSKDFAGSGLRLGCLSSKNTQLTNAVRAICRFSSPSQYSMEIASTILENQDFLSKYLDSSRDALLKSRLLAEQLLDKQGIPYHNHGNAGLFLWLDLSAHLPLKEASDDGWAAQAMLVNRLEEAGVIMSNGSSYRAEKPGHFRVVHCLPEDALREGIKRISEVIKHTSQA